jgi:ABC-type ATPase involved in cell division
VILATHNEHLVSRFPFPRLHLKDGTVTAMPPAAQAP